MRAHPRTTKLARVAAVALGAATLLSAASADAFCGFYVGGADHKLFNNATQVVLMRDGNRTVLSMANDYQGPPQDFAMVVPVPVVLQESDVKVLPASISSARRASSSTGSRTLAGARPGPAQGEAAPRKRAPCPRRRRPPPPRTAA